MSDLSKIRRVQLDQGNAQWVEGKHTGIDEQEADRTHQIGIPHLMSGTIVFVHGVNSEGEWYEDASKQFARGLNTRLGRDDLRGLEKEPGTKRLQREKDGKRARSPIIPFYWGYYVPPGDRRKSVKGNEAYFTDEYGNPLRIGGDWGGGPFQNGTGDLTPFWHPEGFRNRFFFKLFSADAINPVIGRKLKDCPDRLYYVHAARRLANLVKTIRADLPDEPINIVAHSQGTMVALCSLFYLDGVRGPDTLMLNSSPYRFDTFITDYLAAAGGTHKVASQKSRVDTFTHAAKIMQEAQRQYVNKPAPKAACTRQPMHRHKYDDRIFIDQPPDHPEWQSMIGAGPIDDAGRKWWQDPRRARDNRGKLFVNFNPADRVIGVRVVEGIGWRGIPDRFLDEHDNQLGANVMQRAFVRGTDGEGTAEGVHNPAVGSRTNFRMSYFYTQIDRQRVQSGTPGVTWTTGSGGPLEVVDESWRYVGGGTHRDFWYVPSEKILSLLPAMGSLSPPGDGGRWEGAWINAPLVPPPGAPLGKDDFDGKLIRYDGLADPERGIKADTEQQEDYDDQKKYEDHRQIDESSCVPQRIQCLDEKGFVTTRLETTEEVEIRLRDAVGRELVSPTNHAQILRYRNPKTEISPVSHVLAYDLTVGPGYAWGDEKYWNYLLDLADWKISDPYHGTGQLQEKHDDIPPDVVIDEARPGEIDVSATPRAVGGLGQ